MSALRPSLTFLSSLKIYRRHKVRYLSDPSHRGTYESAHSVVLTIFASHGQLHPTHNHPAEQDIRPHQGISFVHQMVPFYTQCLIKVSPSRSLLNKNGTNCGSELERGAFEHPATTSCVRCTGAGRLWQRQRRTDVFDRRQFGMVLYYSPDRRNTRTVIKFMCNEYRRCEATRAIISITSNVDISSPVTLSS